ncbi:MAG: TetR/AcrR family transcriptional regulator, transcriptional repressor for nem operon [Humisphaera sp.]|nr:TetR/AcrR family transcriptional regulator, transcriptional repressor for nem operon [Humisphaera sp.]
MNLAAQYMARPKEFDPDDAAQEAMEAFWERGYAATSVNDLLAEMGLNRGSLYGTFGDKKQLFLAALDRYEAQRGDELRVMLERPGSAKTALVDFIHVAADCCTSQEGRRGCLAGKAAMELAPHDKDVANWLKKFHRRNIDLVARTIARGQEQGEIDPTLDARAVARFLLNAMTGLRLLGTMSPSEAEVQDVVELTLKVLD